MSTQSQNELALLVDKSGLQQETALILKEKFEPFINQAIEWEARAKALKVTDATQLTEMQQAREARLALKKIRLSVADTHKELKADSLKYTQVLDLIKRTLTGMIEPTEAYLQEQEDFAKIAEAKRKEERKKQREELLLPFETQTEFYDLLNMEDAAFQQLYSNCKAGFEQKKADELKAEQERIDREKQEAEEREKQRIELERLRKENEEKERLLKEERTRAEAERKKQAEDARIEREAAERKLAEERAKAAEEQRRINEEKARIERELKAKQEAEEQAKREEEERAEAELAKGDAAKFQDLINDIQALTTKYTFKAKKYKAVHASCIELLNKTVNYLISKQ